ncbi:hypothetical protein L3Y34_004281 [Caenorhabditis briggsae]|uniref:Peptidase C54 catalytic domain-containing protein n=1 Tax=Caenorhabditis briggsae TaxID=6238 RepID=A0AAE9ABJ1_CAEBR|nr:hypothetical protein L3Y34_004281 [Caenorhabditis briggsae]
MDESMSERTKVGKTEWKSWLVCNELGFKSSDGEDDGTRRNRSVIVRPMDADTNTSEEGCWPELKEFCRAHAVECTTFALFLLFGIFCIFNAFGFLGTNELKLRYDHYEQLVRKHCQFVEDRDLNGSEGKTEHPNATLVSLLAVVRHGDRYGLVMDGGCQIATEQESMEFNKYLATIEKQKNLFAIPVNLADKKLTTSKDKCAVGMLTPRGAIQEFMMGRFLFNQYKNTTLFNTTDTPVNITVTFSHLQRTFDSGVALASGFLDQNQTTIRTPIEFQQGSVYYGCTDSGCDCDENIIMLLEMSKAERQGLYRLEVEEKTQQVVQKLFAELNYSTPNMDPLDIIDNLVSRFACPRKPLPCDDRYCASYLFFGDIFEYFSKQSAKLFDLNIGVERQYRVLSAYPILRYVGLMAETNGKQVKLFSSHDTIVGAILRILTDSGKYTDWQVFAARIVFEIYETAEKVKLLRVVYDGQDITSLVKFCKSLEFGLCPVSDLKQFLAVGIFEMAGYKTFEQTLYNTYETRTHLKRKRETLPLPEKFEELCEMSSPPGEDFEKVLSTSSRPHNYCSSESSMSEDDGENEHVLKHGAPAEALTPDSERMVVLGKDLVQSAPGSIVPTENASWINRIKKAGASMMGSMRPSSSSQETLPREETEKQHKKKWKARLWSTWNNIKYSSTWMSDRTDEYGGENDVVFLGKRYSTNKNLNGVSIGFEDFCSDYYSRLWITYRTDFSPLLKTDTTTDCGWGCMIRTTQMMVAQAIMINRFGRNWRFVRRKKSHVTVNGEETEFDTEKMKEWMILKLFEDKPSAPLGIHKMIEIAAREKGKRAVGCWYSPSEAVFIMKKAITESASPLTGDTVMYLSIDGRVHIRDLEVETKHWTKTLMLVIVVRLGAAELNRIYVPHLMRLFSMDSCLGITGGRPDHSCWFVGYYGDQVIYLDPHVAHEYIPIDMDFNTSQEDPKKPKKCPERSYHCRLLSKMHFLDMDPSCALCFRFESREQFDQDMRQLNLSQFIDIDQGEEHGMKRVRDPLFSVVYGERRRVPSYEREVSESDQAQADKHGFEML